MEVRGIILKQVEYKENDRIYTIATDRLGKISCIARGVKAPNSKLAKGLALFCFLELELSKHNDMYIITSSQKVVDFRKIATDLEKCSYAGYFMALSNDLFLEEEPYPELLKLLLNTFYLLSETQKDPELIKITFDLRSIFLSGFALMLDSCEACGGEKVEWIDLNEGIGYCGGCNPGGTTLKISPGAVKTLEHILTQEDQKLFAYSLNNELKKELSHLSETYIRLCMQKEYSSLKYLRNIQKGLAKG
jgi:DNA repair protein recO